MHAIRPAAVAGTFYPADAATLRAQVQACLDEAQEQGAGRGAAPKLLIVPHAGYIYSGPVAGHAYARLAPWAGRVRRVVLAGPTHRVPVRGLAVPTVESFETPLGRVAIDAEAREAVAGLPQVVLDDRAHAHEHSLEVQLPFLQAVLGGGFTLLPLAVGDAEPGEVAEVIERLWGGDETLIVISSDLSHYLAYEHARAVDRATVDRIIGLATDIDPHEACGAFALNGALAAARRHGLAPQLLDLRNSGDTAGDRRRVVGYAALALAPARAATDTAAESDDAALGAALLACARNSIASALGLPLEPEPGHSALHGPGATFVTLRDRHGELRGCVGCLESAPRLDEEVRRNARAAAFRDPRFPPLGTDEWAGLRISVSLLEPPEPLPPARTFADAARLLRPHVDGVVLEWRGHHATLLPQVWAQVPEPGEFLEALLRKAGLRIDFWAEDVQLRRYGARHFAPDGAMEDR
jgi:AmmeMemoRadiSam system protein B/AmmeMemoRadiSam system protein A